MHLNGRGKRLVSKQLASEISKVTVMEAIAPISLGWKEDHKQVGLSNVTYNETETVGNDNPMKELNDVADKQVIENQHEKETSGVSVSVISLNNASH